MALPTWFGRDSRGDRLALLVWHLVGGGVRQGKGKPDGGARVGIALEAAGRPQEALAEFERVFEIQANYPDVALKIRDLRKYLEAA